MFVWYLANTNTAMPVLLGFEAITLQQTQVDRGNLAT